MEFSILDIPDYASSIAALISFHDIIQCVLVNRDWYHHFQRRLWRTVSILDLPSHPPNRTMEELKPFEEYIIRHFDACEALSSKSQYIESDNALPCSARQTRPNSSQPSSFPMWNLQLQTVHIDGYNLGRYMVDTLSALSSLPTYISQTTIFPAQLDYSVEQTPIQKPTLIQELDLEHYHDRLFIIDASCRDARVVANSMLYAVMETIIIRNFSGTSLP
ncbi:hypothetical protein BKA57DRAFT_508830 [Linnemannia elongata]|nr:hypothetical protein BKA57DRAFT_508830 [Linnemannia elongata]